MKTVMDHPRTTYSRGVVNERFDHFSKDLNLNHVRQVNLKRKGKRKIS